MKAKHVISACILTGVTLLAYQNCAPQKLVFSDAIDLASQSTEAPVCRMMTADAVQPQLLYSWNHHTSIEPDYKQVMSSPSVGDIDGDGVPEIAFTSYKDGAYTSKGVLRVLNGANGRVKFSISDEDIRPYAAVTPLLIDIDGDGKAEIIHPHYEGKKIIALNHDGSLRWSHSIDFTNSGMTKYVCFAGFSAADLDKDGQAEIIAGPFILKEKNGVAVQIARIAETGSCFNYAVNLSKDPQQGLRIVGTTGVFDSKGNVIFKYKRSGTPASADIHPDVDGLEIIVTGNGYLTIYNGLTGEVLSDKKLSEHSDLICSVDANGNGIVGGGQASIGDFDGDPSNLEIAVATGKSLTIFDSHGEKIAGSVTQDCSSLSTGLTSFDFNGDGKPEIIYADEQYVRIYEMNGSRNLHIIWEAINPSGTLLEYPVVADVTGDGYAKLIVVSNNMWVDSGQLKYSDAQKDFARDVTGLRVFGPRQAKSWMPTRAVWNQHSYLASNVNDNLTATSSTYLSEALPALFKRNIQKGLFEATCAPQ